MFGLSGRELYSGQTWVYIKENLPYLIVAVLLSANINVKVNNVVEKTTGNKPYLRRLIETTRDITMAAIFLIAVVYIINGTYNPFIYFHF